MALSWIEQIQHFFGLAPKYATWETVGKRLDAEKTVVPVEVKAPAASEDDWETWPTSEEAKGTEAPNIPKAPQTEFEKMYARFNPRTDLIVMSRNKRDSLSPDELNWLDSLGNKVYYFDTDYPVNMALVKSY